MKYDMRHRIQLQNKSSIQNEVGNRVETFVTIAIFLAAYVPNTGRMYWGAGSVHVESDCEFRMRYSPIPQQDMYVLMGTQRFLIQSVIDKGGLHRDLIILCKLEK